MTSNAMKLENISIDVMTSENSLDVTSRPCKIAAAFNKKYPYAGQMADQIRAARIASGSMSASDWGFLSVKPWHDIVIVKHSALALASDRRTIEMCKGNAPFVYFEGEEDVIPLAAACIWNKTRVAVRFDQTMYEELMRTPFKGDLPCDVLLRPRHWCQYFYTPKLCFRGVQVHGAFIFLGRNDGDEVINWIFVLDMEGEEPSYGSIELGPWPLSEAIGRAYGPDRYPTGMEGECESMVDEMQRVLGSLMSMYLYVCSKSPDIIGEGVESAGYPLPVKTKRGPRYFAPDNARTWDVGIRIGAAIRQAALRPKLSTIGADGDGHASPRAHVRCAHWHHYWVGSLKSSDRKTELKWIHPTLVNVDAPSLLPMVIQPVKPANDE
jgi:hypothetical protein